MLSGMSVMVCFVICDSVFFLIIESIILLLEFMGFVFVILFLKKNLWVLIMVLFVYYILKGFFRLLMI